jgi:transcriptional regulator with XRE-family HTH domain
LALSTHILSLIMNKFLTPKETAMEIANRAKQCRIRLEYTQKELAARSGVSFGSVKRFEQKGEISFLNLLKIAQVLRSTEDFDQLFQAESYRSLDEMIERKSVKTRKRVRHPG